MNETICLPNDSQSELCDFKGVTRHYIQDKGKPKYSQNWTAYNQAQTKEKFMFLNIINEAINQLEFPKTKANGRPRYCLGDMIRCCLVKTYNQFSYRRSMQDIKLLEMLKYIPKTPHFNTINNYLSSEKITIPLYELVKITSLPLKDFETDFASDSTGFSSHNRDRWIKVRLDWAQHREYKKLNVMSGVLTNVITSCRVINGTYHDSPDFKSLLTDTVRGFNVRIVTGDGAYASRENAQAVEDIGARPFLKPKKGSRALSLGYPAWNRMIRLFKDNKPLFLAYYHRRSNVESTFHALKRKFGNYLFSMDDQAQINEVLCKVVCYNVSVLVHSIFELNIELKLAK